MKETTPITHDEHGAEVHPSFGWAQVSRLHGGGSSLFDSEILHSEVVRLTVSGATRKRDLNRDWIHGDSRDLIEVRMSMAQWGALVSSFGSSGVPVTLHRTSEDGDIPAAPHEPRMAHSVAEVGNSVDKVLDQVTAATEALRDCYDRKAGRKDTNEALRNLEIALGNAKPNVTFAANSLTEHVENVVTKAKGDIEATVARAAEYGIDASGAMGLLGGAQPTPEALPPTTGETLDA